MRNWNQSFLNSSWMCVQLPDYLWGIETWFGGEHLLDTSWGFQTTYEELKLPFLEEYSLQRLPFSFQTTYEELKLALKIASSVLSWASRLPMRNWNLWKLNRQSSGKWGFQTTYEELKLEVTLGKRDILEGLPDYLWGIETVNIVSEKNTVICFQTTYEELKPTDFKAKVGDWMASRLPMRNWNCSTRSRQIRPLSLPDYLWGIETLSFYEAVVWIPCFQTTYEELKLPDPLLHISRRTASRLPMRNWNYLT